MLRYFEAAVEDFFESIKAAEQQLVNATPVEKIFNEAIHKEINEFETQVRNEWGFPILK